MIKPDYSEFGYIQSIYLFIIMFGKDLTSMKQLKFNTLGSHMQGHHWWNLESRGV